MGWQLCSFPLDYSPIFFLLFPLSLKNSLIVFIDNFALLKDTCLNHVFPDLLVWLQKLTGVLCGSELRMTRGIWFSMLAEIPNLCTAVYSQTATAHKLGFNFAFFFFQINPWTSTNSVKASLSWSYLLILLHSRDCLCYLFQCIDTLLKICCDLHHKQVWGSEINGNCLHFCCTTTTILLSIHLRLGS